MESLVQRLERLNRRLRVTSSGLKQREVATKIIGVLDALMESISDYGEEAAANEDCPLQG